MGGSCPFGVSTGETLPRRFIGTRHCKTVRASGETINPNFAVPGRLSAVEGDCPNSARQELGVPIFLSCPDRTSPGLFSSVEEADAREPPAGIGRPRGKVSHPPVIIPFGTCQDGTHLTEYQPFSSLGWLDFDDAARQKVAELLAALQEPGTLDVLGLATIRDAFSDMLHPGISTLHTRLRYFLFLPWIFQRLERGRVSANEFSRKLREYESRLIECLRHQDTGAGVIGYAAGNRLKTMPSQLYWGGLGAWGLRRYSLSIAEYGRQAGWLTQGHGTKDDDGQPTVGVERMWLSLPGPPEGFLETDITFQLTSEEGQVLVDSVQRHQPRSLLAALFRQPTLAGEQLFPWDIPQETLPEAVTEMLRHARCFSEVTAGPQYVYNVLVARRAKQKLGWDTDSVEESQLAQLSKWIGLVHERHEELASWANDLPSLWSFLHGNRIPSSTRRFITTIARAVVDDPARIQSDGDIHREIRFREMQLKGKRARLGHLGALENWNRAAVGGQLGYRWSIVRGYLKDLVKASEAH